MLQSKLGPASMKLSALYRGKIAGTVEIPYEGTDDIPKTDMSLRDLNSSRFGP